MKRFLALFLSCILILSGCTIQNQERETSLKTEESSDKLEGKKNITDIDTLESEYVQKQETEIDENDDQKKSELYFNSLDDMKLLEYVKDTVYTELITKLDSDDYFVENVETIYISKEYLEELSYNSELNVFFGYTIAELEEQFQGSSYVFTLGENGQTVVKSLEEHQDDTYIQAIKNVAVGSGVILVCVTVAAGSGLLGFPAVSMIFATSAVSATKFGLYSGAISGVAAGMVAGYETHDFEDALKEGTLAASEEFKWSAIMGALTGGVDTGIRLKGATLNGLTMNEAALIQKATKWPLDAVKNIHSMEEYNIYKNAGLRSVKLDGKWAFIKDIDWNFVDSSGRTNAERVLEHRLAPVDATGKSYELHHIGQKADAPLATLSQLEHRGKGNSKILHYAEEGKDITSAAWKQQKEQFWKSLWEMDNIVK